ncbi:MAG TPA: Na+/H+ antiporter [Stellaceae bacterium]|nr:Na+/H+ antiporter [Stellaceae bacterium]
MSLTLQTLVLLLIAIAAVAVAETRLRIPSAILLVITGVVLALIPGVPDMELAPELVLLLVLPPLIYTSAVGMSWREFRRNLRPISLLAVGCVAFTTVVVAAAAHWALGLSWPVGFVLGAIVSPPDSVAPLAVARRMQLPHRILVVLEGEGSANDATALVLYRFAVAAVSLGTFSAGEAATTFVAIVAGEITWGLGVGWLMLRLRRWVGDPRIELTLSVISPYFAYWPPEHLGGSGVLATVCAGLYMSWNGLNLISAATRLQGIFFWDFLIYLVEGLVFLITGLQAHALMERISQYPLRQLAAAAAIVAAVVIVARFVWVFPAAYIPRWLFPRLRRRDPIPPWQWTFVTAFTGVRGIVSMAAALAIPFATASGAAFPDRDLVVFLTFSVILITLVGQGLLLPAVIRVLGLANTGRREHASERADEYKARREAALAAAARLDELAAAGAVSREAIEWMRVYLRHRLERIDQGSDGNAHHRHLRHVHDEVELLMIRTERSYINGRYRDGFLSDAVRRRIERELDLRESELRNDRAAD